MGRRKRRRLTDTTELLVDPRLVASPLLGDALPQPLHDVQVLEAGGHPVHEDPGRPHTHTVHDVSRCLGARDPRISWTTPSTKGEQTRLSFFLFFFFWGGVWVRFGVRG